MKLGKILYLITPHLHTKFEISISWFCQLIPVVVVMKKRSKIYIILVCKILIDGVMVVKIGKIVYVFTQHVHTTFIISTSFISQNIPAEMLLFFMKKRSKIHIILVCKLYIYRAMDLKLGMLVYIITQHILVHFQSQLHRIMKLWLILWYFTIKTVKNWAPSGL